MSFISVFSIIFFFPIDVRLICVCVAIGTTRHLCRRSLFFTILLYRRLLWRTGDIAKKIPITGQFLANEMAFSRRSLYFIILSSINRWRTRCMDQQQQSAASTILETTQQSVRNTTTLIITPTLEVHPRFVCGDKYTWN